ncbi:hypothetical protein KUD11_02250 [Roseovarius sp. LXJ103]|uniref:hypothetical protein n=1 Tax=Roseovarius carneus TaxID=2853164 RepID=UPI000D61AD46|nr:hypothetical protein [Roseovarius carneus]MBZ8117461.1 hypothetical protein [Roseovarius carneus]PWE36737.1 hypothetical protein DD563_12690 [Pelagicola sp. LXJ1103]
MVYVNSDPTAKAGVLALVLHEKQNARSTQDWHKALSHYGYAVQQTDRGAYVTTLPHGVEVCRLPSGSVSR